MSMLDELAGGAAHAEGEWEKGYLDGFCLGRLSPAQRASLERDLAADRGANSDYAHGVLAGVAMAAWDSGTR